MINALGLFLFHPVCLSSLLLSLSSLSLSLSFFSLSLSLSLPLSFSFSVAPADGSGVDRYLFEGECRDSCPEGHFPYHRQTQMSVCKACPENCRACASAET